MINSKTIQLFHPKIKIDSSMFYIKTELKNKDLLNVTIDKQVSL